MDRGDWRATVLGVAESDPTGELRMRVHNDTVRFQGKSVCVKVSLLSCGRQ